MASAGLEPTPVNVKIELLSNIWIKHDFPFIYIRLVPREVLKTEGETRGFQHSAVSPLSPALGEPGLQMTGALRPGLTLTVDWDGKQHQTKCYGLFD